MQFEEILRILLDGRYCQGETLEGDVFTILILEEGRIKVAFRDGQFETWRMVSSLDQTLPGVAPA